MHGKTSKRQRKHKVTQSLKSKQHAPQLDALDILEEQLQQGFDVKRDLEGSNALILPSSKQQAGSSAGTAATAPQQQQQQQQQSKSQLKKLKQVQLKKERREQLSQVVQQLHTNSLPDEQLSLLRPLHQRGARETKKQRLRRALKLQRAGLTGLEEAEDLLQDRNVQGLDGARKPDLRSSMSGNGTDRESDKSEIYSEDERPAKQLRLANGAAAAATCSAAGETADGSSSGQAAAVAGCKAATDSKQLSDNTGKDTDAAAVADDNKKAAADAAQMLRDRVATLKAAARLEATGTAGDDLEVEEAATACQAAAERAAAATAGPTRVVSLQRPPDMEAARQQLPILGLEQEIMEGITHNDVVVLCGETGCGKTTQVPQFLLEAGYGCPDFPERCAAVCVTQPRRVAAISTAERVAAELGVKLGSMVGYQVRHDRRVGGDSRVRFMTDGVLLRQLQSDFLLRNYSIILLDEAHERSLNTDLLLGMLSRLVPLRRRLHEQWKRHGQPTTAGSQNLGPIYPLKLVIMSATLRISDFTENKRLFALPPPVLSVPARQFPVTIHFSRHTELDDYLGAAVRKVCRIHQELPAGGILLFVTGHREVQVAVRRIRQAFARQSKAGSAAAVAGDSKGRSSKGQKSGAVGSSDSGPTAAVAVDQEQQQELEGMDYSSNAAGADAAELAADAADVALEADLFYSTAADAATTTDVDDFELLEKDEDEDEVQVLGGGRWTPEELAAAEARFVQVYGLKLSPNADKPLDDSSSSTGSQQQQQHQAAAPVHVLPLYAMLPQAQQADVFQPVPAGHRLIVIATNVAETSITIPGIRYVVDAGRSKQKVLEPNTGGAVAKYCVDWISKAAAEQRAGRAGRTGPGHVYCLYSSAHYNNSFKQHTDPEIANTPLEGVVLLLKAMGVDKVYNFPFPSPPDADALRSATACLLALSALSPEPHTAADTTQQRRLHHPAAADAASGGRLTELGKAMAVFPITPRHSRMVLQLAVWQQQQRHRQAVGWSGQGVTMAPFGGILAAAATKALPYVVALAAALSLESPFMHIDALQAETEAAAAEFDSSKQGAENHADMAAAEAATAATKSKADNKKIMQAASAAHAQFRSSYGDALSSLNVLIAYEAAVEAKQAERFCAVNFLNARQLREMSQLRQQLGRTLLQLQPQPAHTPSVATGSSSSSSDNHALELLQLLMGSVEQLGSKQLLQPLQPPSSRVLEVLRRALTAGWCDQVSCRVRSSNYIAKLAQEGRLSRYATRYQSATLADEEVFLHPRSCLAKAAPEYVVYGGIVRTAKRPYMATVTAIEPQWLAESSSSLCIVSGPLLEPAPFYDPKADNVLAWHDASYSQHAWQLPRLLLPHPDASAAAAVFAAALLGGRVLPGTTLWNGLLVAPAATAARPELAGLPRVGELITALKSQQVFSRATLAAAWTRQPDFLKQQLGMWLQQRHRHMLEGAWQQLLQQAAAAVSNDAAAGTKLLSGRKRQKNGKQKQY